MGSIGDEDLFQEKYLDGQPSDIYSIDSFSNYGSCTDIFAPRIRLRCLFSGTIYKKL